MSAPRNNNYNRNNNNRNNRRRINNYFTRGIQNGGPNFIDNINPKKLEFDSLNIFRDLARGGVDIEANKDQLANPKLITAMEKVAFENLVKYGEVSSAIQFKVTALSQQGIPISQETMAISNEYGWKVHVYERIYSHIQQFAYTGDIGYIVSLVPQISHYRRYI